MKILYVLPFVPWEVKVRSLNLIPRLARRHEIYLFCAASAGPSKEQKQWLDLHCREAVHVEHSRWKGGVNCAGALLTGAPLRMAYCRSREASEGVRRFYERIRPDVVYVERWRTLSFVPQELEAPLVCDPTDSMTLYNRRLKSAGGWWERLIGWEEHKKFAKYEGELARRAGVCVFCSQADLECVREQAPDVTYEIVPNGVDCTKFRFKNGAKEEPYTIIFTGSFKYRPNRYAVEYFLDQVFPLIRSAVPQAKFLAAGNGAIEALSAYRNTKGFQAVGFVPSLGPYIAKATVAVAPLTVGSGVSNKLGEGFAVGTPVVATPLACGDLPVESGRELLIASNARDFAQHCVALMRSESLRKEMATRARRFVEQKYDWEIVAGKMEGVLQRAADRGAARVDQLSSTPIEAISSL